MCIVYNQGVRAMNINTCQLSVSNQSVITSDILSGKPAELTSAHKQRWKEIT